MNSLSWRFAVYFKVMLSFGALTFLGCSELRESRRVTTSGDQQAAIEQEQQTQGTDLPPNPSPPTPNPTTEPDNSLRLKRRLDPAKPIRIIGIGGWNSCNVDTNSHEQIAKEMNIYPHLLKQANQLKDAGWTVTLDITCFRKSTENIVALQVLPQQSIQEIPVQRFYDWTRQSIASEPDSQIVVIGHSYGGWFSLRLVEHLISQARVSRLFTIDPISPVQCTPASFTSLLFARAGVTDQAHAGCIVPFMEQDLGLFAPKAPPQVGWWLQYHQVDTFKVLHSTAFDQSDENIRYEHRNFFEATNGHINMGKNPDLWADVFRHVVQ